MVFALSPLASWSVPCDRLDAILAGFQREAYTSPKVLHPRGAFNLATVVDCQSSIVSRDSGGAGTP